VFIISIFQDSIVGWMDVQDIFTPYIIKLNTLNIKCVWEEMRMIINLPTLHSFSHFLVKNIHTLI